MLIATIVLIIYILIIKVHGISNTNLMYKYYYFDISNNNITMSSGI